MHSASRSPLRWASGCALILLASRSLADHFVLSQEKLDETEELLSTAESRIIVLSSELSALTATEASLRETFEKAKKDNEACQIELRREVMV